MMMIIIFINNHNNGKKEKESIVANDNIGEEKNQKNGFARIEDR